MTADSRTVVAEPPPSRLRVTIAVLGLLLCLVVVLAATLSPTPVNEGYEAITSRFLDALHRRGVPEWFGYNKLEFTANILMFLPFGFLLALALPRRVIWVALAVVPAFSALVELLQTFFLPARYGNVTDVIANTTGGWIGIGLAVLLRLVIHARDQRIIARALWEEQQVR